MTKPTAAAPTLPTSTHSATSFPTLGNSPVDTWASFLRDPNFLRQIAVRPRNFLDEQQKRNLLEITSLFGVDIELPRKRAKISNGTAGSSTPRAGVTASLQADAPRKPLNWGCVMKTTELVLPQVVQEHLKDHGTDAVAFLEVSSPYEECNGETGVPQALLTHYDYTVGLSDGATKSQICTLFTWLFWYDVLKAARADCTGSRVTRAMVEQMLATLQVTAGSQDRAYEKLSDAQAMANISQWATFGMKLEKVFVEPFGIASLFFLSEKLSPNFMKNKITCSGAEFEDATAHLARLGLSHRAKSFDGLSELGEQIRNCLKAPYPHVKGS